MLPAARTPPGRGRWGWRWTPGTSTRGVVSLYAADGKRALDLLWLAPLKPGEAYGRQPRGAESFGSQPGP